MQENRYDVENLRLELLENGKHTRFVYHDGELLHEEGGKDNRQTGYHLGAGIEAFTRAEETFYYQQNEQLSTAFITGRNGAVHNSYQYDAFGNELETAGRIPNRIRYTGQQYDDATGQYYLRARYYNPVLGRFMQEDIYQGDGLNLYAYCKNNPVTYYDPSGYMGIEPCDFSNYGLDGGESGSNTVNPKDINFMQSSIKNQMGKYTVLGNAEALKSGALKATDLPEIRIWQDADGKLWTLDHGRLASFKIAKLDNVPFRWATDEEVANQMWKMTTKTNGTSIKLKLENGQSITVQ